MSWRERLKPASFRGIEFFIDDADMGFGRRKISHSYPKRDKPFSEDMGRQPRDFSINAYILGTNYDEQVRELINAIENDDSAGTLVHPTLGIQKVVPGACRVRFSNREGGIEYLQLSFSEEGENKFPDASDDSGQRVKTEAASAITQLQTVFSDRFNLSSFPDFMSDDAETVVADAAVSLESAVSVVSGANESNASTLLSDISTFANTVSTLLANPANYASTLANIMDQYATLYPSPANAFAAYRSLSNFGLSYDSIPQTTSTRRQHKINRNQQTRLIRHLALAGMAITAADITFDSYEDAVELRDDLADRMDDEITLLGDTDDDTTLNLMADLRATMVADITARGGSLRRIREYPTRAPLPALVIAYDVYEGVSDEPEIIARNDVSHPAFVPAGKVKVLV